MAGTDDSMEGGHPSATGRGEQPRPNQAEFRVMHVADLPSRWQNGISDNERVRIAWSLGVPPSDVGTAPVLVCPECRISYEYQAWLANNPAVNVVGVAIVNLDMFREDFGGNAGVLDFLRTMRDHGRPSPTQLRWSNFIISQQRRQ